MKRTLKYLSFLLILIPSLFLFAGCKKDLGTPYSFTVEVEEGVILTNSSGTNLENATKYSKEGNTTCFVVVRNDKDASNLKVYLNDSETPLSLTKLLAYDEQKVDSINYQKAYSFTVPQISKNTKIKAEGIAEKTITFTFACDSDNYKEEIASNISVSKYYDNNDFFYLDNSYTLSDIIQNNYKISVPYSNIARETSETHPNFNIFMSEIRFYIPEGYNYYTTYIESLNTSKDVPFEIINVNGIASSTDSTSGLYTIPTPSTTYFYDDNSTSFDSQPILILDIAKLKEQGYLKKDNVYNISLANTILPDFGWITLEYYDETSGQFSNLFNEISSTIDGSNSYTRHRRGKDTVVTISLKDEEIFGSNLSAFCDKIEIYYNGNCLTSNTNTFDNDGVFNYTIGANDKFLKDIVFTVKIKDYKSYEIGFTTDELNFEPIVTLQSTANNVNTNCRHYSGTNTTLSITLDKTKLNEWMTLNNVDDISKVSLSIAGQTVNLVSNTISYTITIPSNYSNETNIIDVNALISSQS